METKYVPVVEARGTFIAEWQKKNGSFKGFKGLCCTIVTDWKSEAGNEMVRIKSVGDVEMQFNPPSGVFMQYAADNPDSKLVIFNKEKTQWTLNDQCPFNWDPVDGLTE